MNIGRPQIRLQGRTGTILTKGQFLRFFSEKMKFLAYFKSIYC